MDNIGQRIRDLRTARHIAAHEVGVNRTYLSKVETGVVTMSLEMIERLSERFEIAPARLLGPQEQFDALLALEDDFVQAVIPYLKQLNETQKKEILITLEAAPKQLLWTGRGRPLSGHTRKAI